MGLGNLFSFFDKLLSKLPLQDRKERIKNRIDDLEKEKNEIIKLPPNINRSRRLDYITVELQRLYGQVKNLE